MLTDIVADTHLSFTIPPRLQRAAGGVGQEEDTTIQLVVCIVSFPLCSRREIPARLSPSIILFFLLDQQRD